MSTKLTAEDVHQNLRSQMAEFRFLHTPFRDRDIGDARRPAIMIIQSAFMPDDMRPKRVFPVKVDGVDLKESYSFPIERAMSLRFVENDVSFRVLAASSLRMNPVPGVTYNLVLACQYGRDDASCEARATFLDEITDRKVYVPPPGQGQHIPVTTPLFPSKNKFTGKFEGIGWHGTGRIMILPKEFAEKMEPSAWGVPATYAGYEVGNKIVLMPISAPGKGQALARYLAAEVELTDEQFLFNGQVFSLKQEVEREQVEIPGFEGQPGVCEPSSFKKARKETLRRLHPDRLGPDAPTQLKNLRQMKFSKIEAAFDRIEELYFVSKDESGDDNDGKG